MKNILIVEDDRLLGRSILDTLKEEGYQAVWMSGSDQAWAALALQPFDLIYLDIMLSGSPEDGYHILQKLRAEGSQHQLTPIVMLSNFGQANEIQKAMELGANDYIIKANIDLEYLLEVTITFTQKAGV